MGEESEIKEKHYISSRGKTFRGYFLPSNSVIIAMIGIFGALICVLTMIIQIPVPATKGFINIGDIGVMIAGLLLGPIVGGIAGGLGSMLADIFTGYVIYAPATLIIKGLEGFLIGIIANPRKNYKRFTYRDVVAVVIGGLVMVFGYFIYELILFGFPAALFEFFLNGLIQFGLSAVFALIFSRFFRTKIIDALPEAFEKVFIIEIPGSDL